MTNAWPRLDYNSWRETCSALHLYLQIAGKYRLAHTPWLNHSWHATFYVTPRGLASSPIPDGSGIEILFDLRDHVVIGTSGDGRTATLPLGPTTVSKFHADFVRLISALDGTPSFNGQPNEVPDPVPFAVDHQDRPYDRDAVQRFHQALVAIDGVFNRFRTSFTGKSSPVHLFWGSFDLAVTRFSGRRAPLHAGGIPALPDHVAQEAYDREVSSVGFWPGGGAVDYPAFYSYAYPAPEGFRGAPVQPDAAFWHETLSEFILPYEAVQSAADPDERLLSFLNSTYEAAANLGRWDRELLESAPGRPREARHPDAHTGEEPPAGTSLPIEQQDDGAKGRYRILIKDKEAEMTYRRSASGVITIDHTGVPLALRGRRIGESLVRRAVEDARRDGVKIIPLCPFAKAQIERHPEWQDVLR
jgi:predicted GNAT family acetyltransferase